MVIQIFALAMSPGDTAFTYNVSPNLLFQVPMYIFNRAFPIYQQQKP